MKKQPGCRERASGDELCFASIYASLCWSKYCPFDSFSIFTRRKYKRCRNYLTNSIKQSFFLGSGRLHVVWEFEVTTPYMEGMSWKGSLDTNCSSKRCTWDILLKQTTLWGLKQKKWNTALHEPVLKPITKMWRKLQRTGNSCQQDPVYGVIRATALILGLISF